MCIIERERERVTKIFFSQSLNYQQIYQQIQGIYEKKIKHQLLQQFLFSSSIKVKNKATVCITTQFCAHSQSYCPLNAIHPTELAAICTVLVCPMNQKKESINTAPVLCVINEYRVLYSEFTLSVSFSGVGQCFLCSNVSEIKDTLQFYIIFKYIVNLYMLIIFNYVSNLVKK